MKKILFFAAILATFASISSCKKGLITIKAITGEATEITESGAYISGQAVSAEAIASDIKMGVLYSTSKEVIYDSANKIEATDISDDYKFNVPVTGLKQATTYYYRSYVYQNGAVESYGLVKSFTTAPETVDLGLSVKWATCNIGAASPEEYGRYFAWGDVVGQTWSGSSWSGDGFSSAPSCELDADENLKPEYDAAYVLFGGSCRMPTKFEQKELIDNCIWTWTDNYRGTGVAGRIFTSKKVGYLDKSIFLPAAGYGFSKGLDYAAAYGLYWSSSLCTDNSAYDIKYDSYTADMSNESRVDGYPIRPVCEK